MARTFKNCGKDEPVVLAEHSLGLFYEPPSPEFGNIAFNLAGHIHGGQLAIGGKVIFTPRGSGRYVAGWYPTAWGDLYVSRGVGTSIIPLRIGARPEIVARNQLTGWMMLTFNHHESTNFLEDFRRLLLVP